MAKVAMFQTLFFFRISSLRGLERLRDIRLYHFHDIRVVTVAKVARQY